MAPSEDGLLLDEYTLRTRRWLESRFRDSEIDGVYQAHQPIYGFRAGGSEPGIVGRYVVTYRILRALSRLRFGTLLDAGCAEGYTANLVRRLLHASVTTSDLSREACRRATSIFGLSACAADIHSLPFSDNRFDVVLCSETLEHVVDPRRALDEVLRVARMAAVITVPNDPLEEVQRNIRNRTPHGHIHKFTCNSLDYLSDRGFGVTVQRIYPSALRLPALLVEAMPRVRHGRSLRRWAQAAYDAMVPILARAFGVGSVAALLRMEADLGDRLPGCKGFLFVVEKRPGALRSAPLRSISARQMIRTGVHGRELPLCSSDGRIGSPELAPARTLAEC
jgi:SAM-dependent methyltransferase